MESTMPPMTIPEKVHENRVRRFAGRRGLVLRKRGGRYTLVQERPNGARYHATDQSLDGIEMLLAGGPVPDGRAR